MTKTLFLDLSMIECSWVPWTSSIRFFNYRAKLTLRLQNLHHGVFSSQFLQKLEPQMKSPLKWRKSIPTDRRQTDKVNAREGREACVSQRRRGDEREGKEVSVLGILWKRGVSIVKGAMREMLQLRKVM